jgi:hypothetical protein
MISVDPLYVHTLKRKVAATPAPKEENKAADAEANEAVTADSTATEDGGNNDKTVAKTTTTTTTSSTAASAAPSAADSSSPTSSSSSSSPSSSTSSLEGLPFVPHPFMAPWMFIPPYLEVNYPTCSTVFLRSPLPQPDRVEVPSPLPPSVHQLGFEWYNTIKRRKTKRVDGSPLVVNGKTVMLKPKFDRMVRADQHKARYKRLGKLFNIKKIKVRYNPRFIKK